MTVGWVVGSYLRIILSDANSPPLPLKQPDLASVRGRGGKADEGDVTKVSDKGGDSFLFIWRVLPNRSSLITCKFLGVICFFI